MAAQTVTTIVLVLFATGVLALSGYTWFGSWQPVVRRPTHEDRVEAEFQVAVREMRRAIDEYERGERFW